MVNKSRLLDLAFGRRFNWSDMMAMGGFIACLTIGGKLAVAAFPWVVAWIIISWKGENRLAEHRKRLLQRARLLPPTARITPLPTAKPRWWQW